MGIRKALKALDAAVSDLTSLHVQTYTGDLKTVFDGTKPFATLKAGVEKANKDGEITLVAETLAQFDGDSYNFVSNSEDGIPSSAFVIHKNAVESGIETRLGLLSLFKDAIS